MIVLFRFWQIHRDSAAVWQFRSHSAILQPSRHSTAISLISMFHVSFWKTSHMGTWEIGCWRFLCYQFDHPRHQHLQSTRSNFRSNPSALTALRKLLVHVGQTMVPPCCASDGQQYPSLDSCPKSTEQLQLTPESNDVLPPFIKPVRQLIFRFFPYALGRC